MIIITCILIILIIVVSIFPYSEQDLGDGYYYLPLYEAVDVGFSTDSAFIYKGSQQYSYDKILLSGDIFEVSAHKNYILVGLKDKVGNKQYFTINKKDSTISPSYFNNPVKNLK